MVDETLCDRCKGNIIRFEELDGSYWRCIQCGRPQMRIPEVKHTRKQAA